MYALRTQIIHTHALLHLFDAKFELHRVQQIIICVDCMNVER